MAYKITISYSTGNSLESSDCVEDLGIKFEDLSIAKENLQRIKEHYDAYEYLESGSHTKKERQEKLDSCESKPWFTEDLYGISLKCDNGAEFRISCFWIGYFDHLYSAEIVLDHTDMKIEF